VFVYCSCVVSLKILGCSTHPVAASDSCSSYCANDPRAVHIDHRNRRDLHDFHWHRFRVLEKDLFRG